MKLKLLKRNSLLKLSAIYSISNFINAGINFMLIPVLTRYISKLDYGLLTMFTLFITFLTPFVGLSIHGAITRKYYQKDDTIFPKYIGNCLNILLISTIIITSLCKIFESQLELLMDLNPRMIYGVILICFFQFINLILLSVWQAQIKAVYYGIFQFILAVLNISLSLYFVIGLKLGWEGRIYGLFIATALMAIVAFGILYYQRIIIFSFNLEYLKHALRFSLPLIPHSIGAVLISMSDRFILKDLKGLEETGLYMSAYQIASIFGVLLASFNSAFVPWLYKKLNENDDHVKLAIVKMTYKIMIFLIFIGIFGSIIIKPIWPLILGNGFLDAYKYFPLLLLSFIFNGMYLLVTNYLYYVEKTAILGYLTVLIVMINIPLTYILIKFIPYNGAAYAVAGSSFIMFTLTWYFAAKAYRMPWGYLYNKNLN